MRPRLTDSEFIEAWNRHGSAKKMATALNMDIRAIYARRARMTKTGMSLPTSQPDPSHASRVPPEYRSIAWTYPLKRQLRLDNGVMVVSSDHHYWPGMITTAHRALVKVCQMVKPRVKLLNGDVFDGDGISRHPPPGWSERPNATQQLEACKDRVAEIEAVLPRGCDRIWVIGNHDERFDRTLATQAPQFAGLIGTRLADHFNDWEFTRSLWINWEERQPVVAFHNYANGIHAGYNNAMKSGVTIVTGHTHALEVKPFNDLRGRRYGIQTGTVADPDDPQFEYAGARPSQACSGFVVLTFRDGQLLQPELCEVVGGKAWFRGEVIA